jgi:hypothetical protein
MRKPPELMLDTYIIKRCNLFNIETTAIYFYLDNRDWNIIKENIPIYLYFNKFLVLQITFCC